MKVNVKSGTILIYNICLTGLAIFSMVLTALSLIGTVSLRHGTFGVVFFLIWIVFFIDYVARFWFAKSKKDFLIQNMFDLIALIPSHPVFAFFRISRIIQIIRYHHLFWKLGWSGKFTKSVHRFLYDTGFIYLLSISLVIVIFSSLIFAAFEHDSLEKSLWWAITTATTVGYGDVTPTTGGGRIISAVLMLGGIGFIGLLTSTITDFFTDQDQEDEQTKSIQQLTNQVEHLSKQVAKMQKTLNANQGKPATSKKHKAKK
ncbi:potassium channel family protein [Lentilactobacillus kosonis]|uniref:Potassium voltage-gated channel subfamily KQT n=1 Tax=Lentilactobacillus kosonis TaxID=2810561 RepID=A0A401FIB6_9LACO|nr:potassium channel family protein [Lentilactobacillus kosonis]GAY72130.1 potassium voltage-gated channel subfamily KQT [Lentilactobacillus kosonis]